MTVTEPPGAAGPEPQAPTPAPPLRPISRRSQNRVTLYIAGALALLVLVRVFQSHPLPQPSHQTPAAAVAGYLLGLERHNLGEVRSYLAPNQRSRAGGLLAALSHQRALITAPALAQIVQNQRTATVAISLQLCYRPPGHRHYLCGPLAHSPLGLPVQISCLKVGGRWYATTLFKPT